MKYRVAFEGRWRGDFDDLEDAMSWGREVAETDRLVYVAKASLMRTKLVAVLPEDRASEGIELWRSRMAGSGSGSGMGG